MEPFSAMLGLGMSLVGTFMGMGAASKANRAQQAEIRSEQGIEGQKQQAMELDANRRQMEVVRNNQRARAMGLEAATNQGAQMGSGLQGAYGQIRGQSGVNSLGISQNLEIGRNIFGLNSEISQDKIQIAQAQQESSFAGGLSSLGGSIFGASKSLSNLGFGGYSNTTPIPNYGYGNGSGMQTGFYNG